MPSALCPLLSTLFPISFILYPFLLINSRILSLTRICCSSLSSGNIGKDSSSEVRGRIVGLCSGWFCDRTKPYLKTTGYFPCQCLLWKNYRSGSERNATRTTMPVRFVALKYKTVSALFPPNGIFRKKVQRPKSQK